VSLRFLHTADWQLGKPFASLQDDSKRHRLQQERLNAIQRLSSIAIDSNASFILVAGDLFDSSQATKSIVSSACAAIGLLKIPVLVIPGNHDHGGPGSIWEQEFFKREQQQLAPNLRLLLSPEPVVLETAVIFPAPLLRRHESGDPTAWIRDLFENPTFPESSSLTERSRGSAPLSKMRKASPPSPIGSISHACRRTSSTTSPSAIGTVPSKSVLKLGTAAPPRSTGSRKAREMTRETSSK